MSERQCVCVCVFKESASVCVRESDRVYMCERERVCVCVGE